jgi:hypothetical protein
MASTTFWGVPTNFTSGGRSRAIWVALDGSTRNAAATNTAQEAHDRIIRIVMPRPDRRASRAWRARSWPRGQRL